jgi:hypothetical protein
MVAVMDSAMLISLGYSEKAAEYEQLVKQRTHADPVAAAQV